MLIQGALFAINKQISLALKRDLSTQAALLKLAPYVAVIFVNDMNLFLQITLTQHAFTVEKIKTQEESNLFITGTASGLAFALLHAVRFKEWRLQDLQLNGDVETFQKIMAYFAALDLNVDGWLAQYAGDEVAHLARKGWSRLMGWKKSVKADLIHSSLDYLHSELKWLPNKIELQDFYDEVDALNLRVERLKARLERIVI